MTDVLFAPIELRAQMREILKDYLSVPEKPKTYTDPSQEEIRHDVQKIGELVKSTMARDKHEKETKNYWLKPSALAMTQMPRFRVSGFVLSQYTGDLKKILLKNKNWFVRWRNFFTNNPPLGDGEYEKTINEIIEKVKKLPFPDYFLTLHSELLRNFGFYRCKCAYSDTLFMEALQAGYEAYEGSELHQKEADDLYDCIALFDMYVKNWFGDVFRYFLGSDWGWAYGGHAENMCYQLVAGKAQYREKYILEKIKDVKKLIRHQEKECPDCTYLASDLQVVYSTLLVLQQKAKLNETGAA